MMSKILTFISVIGLLFLVSCNSPVSEKSTQQEITTQSEPVEFKDFGPEPFILDIEEYTLQNETFRTAVWTGKYMQMTVMKIMPGEDIGLELHTDIDQFIRIEEGSGVVMMGDVEDNLDFQQTVSDDFAIFIPAGKWHNIKNNSDKPLKLYSIYAPVEHPHSTVHKTREEGLEAHVH